MNNEQYQWTPAPKPENHPVGKRELCFAGCALLFSLLSVNGLLYGGINLVFAVGFAALILSVGGFLLRSQKRPTAYGVSLLALSMVIVVGFARSDDSFVKNVLLIFVLLAVSMAVTIAAGMNRNDGRGIRSLGWAIALPLGFGLGGIPQSMGGLFGALRQGKGKNVLAVLGGLAIAVPVLLILVPLLIKADAAFDGMMGLLPEVRVSELFSTLFFGLCVAVSVFSFGLSMVYGKPEQNKNAAGFRGVNAVTVCTVLIMVCGVYVLYLLSQLAYLVGGLSGILPEDYTLAEYARRGFFEMALLCLINLAVMVGTIALIRKDKGIPGLCRWLCAFIGLITLFFVVSAGAKMGLYIKGYGLTRLRILTLVITAFLGLCALTVTVWLFVSRLPYMKIIFLAALVIGVAVLWVDVDTVVASYNVNAYLDGRLEYVDISYLATLSDSAVPYIELLWKSQDPEISKQACLELINRSAATCEDIRGWNYVSYRASKIIEAAKHGK